MSGEQVRGRSALLGTTVQLLGFGFDEHPQKAGWHVHLVFYRVVRTGEIVICVSEIFKPEPELMRPYLGTQLPGDRIAAYAQRSVDGMSYEDFRSMIHQSYSHVVFEWWDDGSVGDAG